MILRNCSIVEIGEDSSVWVEDDCAISIVGETIRWVGRDDALPRGGLDELEIDCGGRLVTAGLIDCHTHLLYGGNRSQEFALRLRGLSYEEIAREGGGIRSTVEATRLASDDQLFCGALDRLRRMSCHGTTTVEIKSGYGFDITSELRLLELLSEVQQLTSISVVPTCLALHSSPSDSVDRANYLRQVNELLLPEVASRQLAPFVDAFCESIAFSLGEVQEYYETAQRLGLGVRGHVDQLSSGGGAQLLARFGGLCADHLEYSDEEGIAALARAGTVAVLLPGAFYFLRERQLPPIELLRRYGVPIALATDANPGTSPLLSLPLAMNMACTLFGLTTEEALCGVTLNAARALGLRDRGALRPSWRADIAIWDLGDPSELAYFLGESYLWASLVAGQLIVEPRATS